MFPHFRHGTVLVTVYALCVLCVMYYYLNKPTVSNVLDSSSSASVSTSPMHHTTRRAIESSSSDALSIKISIPSTCSAKEYQMRAMQRQSWLQYINESNADWSTWYAGSGCSVSYNYLIGNCDDGDNVEIAQENDTFGDIHRLDIEEHWEKLQQKTIELVLWEFEHASQFDILCKTDTDTYVNVPKMCDFMMELMREQKWRPQNDAFYLGRPRNNVAIRLKKTHEEDRYVNRVWYDRIHNDRYLPYMAGFGYFLSRRSAEIMYYALRNTKHYVAENKMEDCYVGHFLSSYNVSFLELGHVISERIAKSVKDLKTFILDHPYKEDPQKMVDKFQMHTKLSVTDA